MNKQLTRSEKETIRAYVLDRDGADKARIMADGSVNVFGTMPNTDEDGWYLAGYADDLLAEAVAAA